MNMIWYNNLFVYGYGWVFYRNLPDKFFCNHTVSLWDGKPVPYDMTEELLSVLGADGDGISTVLAVIVAT